MSVPEPIMLPGIVLLWTVLVTVLGRASYGALKKGRRTEGVFLLIVTIAVVLFTAQWIAFFVWAIACAAGLPIGCMK